MKKNIVYEIFGCLIFILLVIIMILTFGEKNIVIQKVAENTQEIAKETVVEQTYQVQKYTELDISDVNKLINVKLSMECINNITLKPGDEFSFNNVVGERTVEKGYKEATVIYKKSNGEPYRGLGIGGGICQVSSTLYMACKELNLEIIERRPHSSRVDYCSADDEAMINWGTSDFRFKNNINRDITLKLYLSPVEGNDSKQKIVCEIW